MKNEIIELKSALNFKNLKIDMLEQQICRYTSVQVNEHSDASSDLDNNSYKGDSESDENENVENADNLNVEPSVEKVEFYCDLCDFKTEKRCGVSIHRSKKHKYHCVGCADDFPSNHCLRTHMCDEVENLENPNYENLFIKKSIFK